MEDKLTDAGIMPYGRYQGWKMIDVPAEYLLWLFENHKCDRRVRDYIEDNMSALEMEVKAKKHKS